MLYSLLIGLSLHKFYFLLLIIVYPLYHTCKKHLTSNIFKMFSSTPLDLKSSSKLYDLFSELLSLVVDPSVSCWFVCLLLEIVLSLGYCIVVLFTSKLAVDCGRSAKALLLSVVFDPVFTCLLFCSLSL